MEIHWKYTRNRSVELEMARETVVSGRMAVRCWFLGRVISFELQVFCIDRAMVTFCSGRPGRRSA